MSLEAYIACNRFGLGARDDELSRVSADPRGWLQAQIKKISALEKIDNRVHEALTHNYRRNMNGVSGKPPDLPFIRQNKEQ